MCKLYLSLFLVVFFYSCSMKRAVTSMDEGYYLGRVNKNVIFKYNVLVRVKDSTAILDVYRDEKGMTTSYDIFNGKEIIPNSESFRFLKNDSGYIFFNSSNKFNIEMVNGKFLVGKPLNIKLKYYKDDPINLYPSKKFALYCFCWLYPHVIIGSNKLDPFCENYVQNEMDKNLKKIDNNLSYDKYYYMIKDSILQYKINFENASK